MDTRHIGCFTCHDLNKWKRSCPLFKGCGIQILHVKILSLKLFSDHLKLYFSPGTALLDHLTTLTDLLDKTLHLDQKDEYEIASTLLQNTIVSLIHIRPKQVNKSGHFTFKIFNSGPLKQASPLESSCKTGWKTQLLTSTETCRKALGVWSNVGGSNTEHKNSEPIQIPCLRKSNFE